MPIRTDAMLGALFASAMLIPAPAQAQQGRAAPAAAPVATACTDGQGPTSAFVCAPLVNNESVRACATNAKGAALTQCQQAAAVSFCRTRSYSAAAAYQVTPSGNLSEVLCRAPMVAAAASQAAAPAMEQAAPAEMNSVYATTARSGATPTLTLSPFGPEMTGTYTVTQDEAFFDSVYQVGGGTITEGRLEGTLNGNVFTGYWYEAQGRTGVQRECSPARGSDRVFGRFTFTFSADRKSFTGRHSTCDGTPSAVWNGTLIGQVPAVAAGQKGNSGSATATAQTAPSGKRNKNRKAPTSETVADRLAREAADEAERATGDKVRRGVRDVIEGKLPF
jgi:hypothetical protein